MKDGAHQEENTNTSKDHFCWREHLRSTYQNIDNRWIITRDLPDQHPHREWQKMQKEHLQSGLTTLLISHRYVDGDRIAGLGYEE
jgi:hypothetical protein